MTLRTVLSLVLYRDPGPTRLELLRAVLMEK
jgi:hypothetical protein